MRPISFFKRDLFHFSKETCLRHPAKISFFKRDLFHFSKETYFIFQKRPVFATQLSFHFSKETTKSSFFKRDLSIPEKAL